MNPRHLCSIHRRATGADSLQTLTPAELFHSLSSFVSARFATPPSSLDPLETNTVAVVRYNTEQSYLLIHCLFCADIWVSSLFSFFFFFFKSSPEWRNQCTHRPPLMPSNTSKLVLQQTRMVKHVFLGGFPSAFILRCNCLLSLLLVWELVPTSCSDLFLRMFISDSLRWNLHVPTFTANLHV